MRRERPPFGASADLDAAFGDGQEILVEVDVFPAQPEQLAPP